MITPGTASLEQLRWRCRRGMLELDLLLNEFLSEHFDQLEPAQLELFAQLLDYPDAVLLDLLLGNSRASEPEMAVFIDQVRLRR